MAPQQLTTTADRALLSADAKVTALRAFAVRIGSRENPRQTFTVMAADSFTAHEQNVCLAEPGERVEVEPVPSDGELLAADIARNVNKGERLARANDAHALDLQVQLQGFIGGLPA